MGIPLATTYSTINPEELMTKIIPKYCIDNPLECLFWERGSNDTYQIRCADTRYFLRVYRCGAFPREAVEFEAEVLSYLHQQGLPVAYPIARKAGGYITQILAPEGPRFVLITAVAEGATPDYNSLHDCQLVGQSVAQFHTVSSGFKTTLKRPQLDLDDLVPYSLRLIRDHFSGQHEALIKIEKIVKDVQTELSSAPTDSLDFGICHGDLHGWNLHIHKDKVTHFDFEECAFGYRLYDLATLKWGVCFSRDHATEKWEAFLKGYESIRPLSKLAHSLVGAFMILRELAETAYGIRHVNDFGHNDIMASDVDRVCSRLEKLHQNRL